MTYGGQISLTQIKIQQTQEFISYVEPHVSIFLLRSLVPETSVIDDKIVILAHSKWLANDSSS